MDVITFVLMSDKHASKTESISFKLNLVTRVKQETFP